MSFSPELLEANALRMRAICVLLDGPNHPQPSEKGQGASKCTFQVVHCVVSAVKAIWADSKLRKRLEALPTRINLCMATSYLLADVLGHDFSSQEESNTDGKRLCFNATKFLEKTSSLSRLCKDQKRAATAKLAGKPARWLRAEERRCDEVEAAAVAALGSTVCPNGNRKRARVGSGCGEAGQVSLAARRQRVDANTLPATPAPARAAQSPPSAATAYAATQPR